MITLLMLFSGNPYKASCFGVVVLQSCLMCLAISTSNFTDQFALLAFKSAIKLDPYNELGSNWTEKANFCDWLGISCSRRRQRVTALSLPHMGLQGTISSYVGNLSFLVVLDLRNNSFHGHLTHEISRLHRLKGLILQNNMLEGDIPLCLYQCRKLQIISLTSNGFTGGVPKELTTLPFLHILYLGINKLTGTIPPSLGNTSRLEWLGLELNNFHGNIPTELERLPVLKGINFYANHLSGLIPPEILNMSSVQDMLLGVNAFSGNLPSTTGLWLPNLNALRLDYNLLSGNIPSYLSNSSKLTSLELEGNSFTGPIPTSLGQLQIIELLRLDNNRLTTEPGSPVLSFLAAFANCKSLITLNLSRNNLKGTIPAAIGKMEKLQRLYLDGNKVEGSIPDEICRLSNLGEIYLQNNNLSGNIPSCIGNLSSLQRMILSSNNLSSIPMSLWNLESLLFLDLSFNSLRGILDPNLRASKVIEIIDLSWNQISGNIPSAMGAFQSLTSLNLSRNSFSGSIPKSLGDLITLDFLDLSHNNLSGAIPKSFEAISHLKYLNLSFNKLSGEIPSGGPFANFTAESFMENEALCGKPILQVPTCKSHYSKNSWNRNVLLKYVLPATALVVIFVALFFMLKKYGGNNVQNPHSTDLLEPIEHRMISYQELRHATNGFCEATLIGVGSFGSVYKGILLDGTNVAVKVLNLQLEGAIKSFDAECRVLRRARHRNLVKVITSCSNPELRALVLQYMSNGSLERWLYSHNYCLDLLQRVNIILDVALAVEYLHHGQSEPVVHCDLKPSNVLLNEEMIAHVSDFGIAKILTENKTATQTTTIGTLGYIAPEYGFEGRVSTKGDVYSYGIMLLETFTRKKPTDEMFSEELSLRQWVSASLPNRVMEVVDSSLLVTDDGVDMSNTQRNLLTIMDLGLECSKEVTEERSNIKEVVVKLNKIKLQLLRDRGI